MQTKVRRDAQADGREPRRKPVLLVTARERETYSEMVRDTGFEPPPASLREALRARCDPLTFQADL